MSNNESVFSFELDESVYFSRDDEVSEIVGISLEPNIAVQPFQEYISIRGVMELVGEYIPSENRGENQANVGDTKENHLIEQVIRNDDGVLAFSHRFPIEISVPIDRVQSLNDISVGVDEFDYEVPTSNQLRFASTIHIYGINETVQDAENRDVVEDEEDGESTLTTDSEQETFTFDVKNDEEKDTSEEKLQEKAQVDHEEEKGRWKEKSQTLHEFFHHDEEPSVDEAIPSNDLESDADDVNIEGNDHTFVSEENINGDVALEYEEDQDVDHIERPVSTDVPPSSEETLEPSGEVPEQEAENTTQIKKDDNSKKDTIYVKAKNREGKHTVHAERIENDNKKISREQAGNVNKKNVKQETVREVDEQEEQKENVSFLSSMLHDREEHFAKMRVCIVQEHDTLASIANKYDMTTIQFLKKNQLPDENVEAGQILYIPDK